jgi:hypothetical protein
MGLMVLKTTTHSISKSVSLQKFNTNKEGKPFTNPSATNLTAYNNGTSSFKSSGFAPGAF